MKRPTGKQAGIGAGVIVLVLVVWLLMRSSSSSSSAPTYNRKVDSQGPPFSDAAAAGQPVVGVYGVDWF